MLDMWLVLFSIILLGLVLTDFVVRWVWVHFTKED